MIEFQDVVKVYPRRGQDDVVALDGISLTVPDGDIHAIVGESGAGKSTLIRCLTALERPTSGRILLNEIDLTTLAPTALRDVRRSIGMVFQGGNLLDSRTAAGNIAYPLKITSASSQWQSRAAIRERVEEMLALVGLADRASSFPSQLSGGQRQRVGIARAMADSPSVLLCDEPTSALDTETTNQILDLLKSVRDQYGVTVLIITHEMSVVRRICDSVTLLDHGSVVESGSVANIVADVHSPLGLRIIPPPDVEPGDGQAVIDVSFTSHPGQPTGSRVMAHAAELGADIGAGVFETIGETQVARLALTVPATQASRTVASLQELPGVSAALQQEVAAL